MRACMCVCVHACVHVCSVCPYMCCVPLLSSDSWAPSGPGPSPSDYEAPTVSMCVGTVELDAVVCVLVSVVTMVMT